MNDELIIIRATIALNPEKLEEFRQSIIRQRSEGVIVLPPYVHVLAGNLIKTSFTATSLESWSFRMVCNVLTQLVSSSWTTKTENLSSSRKFTRK